MPEGDEFAAFVATSSRRLLRAGWMLTGDWSSAEDLVQSALVATWKRWQAAGPVEFPEAYVRRAMVTTYIRWNKRRWRNEIATAELPDGAGSDDAFDAADVRQAVRQALAVLPAKQRAVVVLRYFEDLSEAQTAAAMGCAVGTVKSQAAKALDRLQQLPALVDVFTEGHVR